MFDTMTLTKTVAALCGALLVLLLGKWAAESLYHVDGHGEAAYVIDTGAEEAAEEEVVEVDFGELMASADVGKGAKLFKKCAACHKLEAGVNAVGPSLYGVVGREVASEDFAYSDVVAGLGGAWDADALNGFLANPKEYAPGNKMSFPGFKKPEERANIIAYLDSIDN